jgi:ATP-dependent exoDNAse (exonuclease V) alpha subunit
VPGPGCYGAARRSPGRIGIGGALGVVAARIAAGSEGEEESVVAIYHYSHKPVSRAQGRSAVAAAAYRAADRLHDQSVGQTFDYSRRHGVVHTEIVLPSQAVKRDIQWPRNRQALWNAAEAAEKRKDARVAREHEVALPNELTKAQQIVLLREFSSEIANRYNVAVDFALHHPHREGDQRNDHAHIFATTREITPTGLGAKASIELSDTDRFKRGLPSGRHEITAMRARWGEIVNEHLKQHKIEARIDHRTLEAQGIEREPTVHVGPAVTEMRRRGIETEVDKRMAWQEREALQGRLERASEIGRLEHKRIALAKSILELSVDIEAARRERDRMQAQRSKEVSSPARSVDALQREGREAWLKLRAERAAKELEEESERSPEPEPGPVLVDLDELRAQGREAWRQSRERATPEAINRADNDRRREVEQEPNFGGPELEP